MSEQEVADSPETSPRERPRRRRSRGMFSKVAEVLTRTAASAGEIIADRELRKKATNLVATRAGAGIKTLQEGVQSGAQNIQHGLNTGITTVQSGPRQIQSMLARLQQRIEEQRLQAQLQAERDAPVDVQMGPVLYEDAPQELRSRLWLALLENPSLTGNLHEQRDLEELLSPKHSGSQTAGSLSSILDERRQSNASASSQDAAAARRVGSQRSGGLDDEQGLAPSSRQETPADDASDRAASAAGVQQAVHTPGAVSISRQSGNLHDAEATRQHAHTQQQEHQLTDAQCDMPSPSGSEQPGGDQPCGWDAAAASPSAALLADTRTSPSKRPTSASARASANIAAVVQALSPPSSPSKDTSASPSPADASTAGEPARSAAVTSADRAAGTAQADSTRCAGTATPAGSVGLPGSNDRPSGEPSSSGPAQDAPSTSGAHSMPSTSGRSAGSSPSRSPEGAAALSRARNRDRERAKTMYLDPIDPATSPVVYVCQLSSPSREQQAEQDGSAGPSGTPDGAQHDAGAAGRAGGGGDQPDAAWEMVEGTSQLFDWRGKMGLEAQLQPCFPSQFGPEAETLRHRLMLAAMAMPWPISPEYAEDCKYNVLLQISIGQEEVDEVISRDINRTFPEHPQFGFQQGQQALFRVLKAYSLHDLEVGYCQGMAFVAGIILMYVPEEPSFRTLARLMDSQGPNLRRLYLPGLEGLKQQLRMLEWLMERLYPDLKAHLEAFGAVPVLYASQWFLTVFSCPFPASFSCRVIDVMLIENRAHILLRAALAVLAECDADLMALHDFEDLITYVKIEPVRWAHHRSRKVLNLAVTDFVSDDMIAAAQHAIENGYEGSMSRRSSSITEAAAAAAIAAVESASGPPTRNTSMGRLAGAAAGDPSAEASPLLADVSAKLAAMQAAGVSPNLMPAHPRHPSAGGKAGASGERDGAVEAELASQKADMDADYMAMVLALDVLWAGDNSGVQQQTAQQAQQQQQQQGEDQHAQHS